MSRRILFAAFILFSIGWVAPADAQTPYHTWTAWVANPTGGRAWLIADDGTVLNQQDNLSSDGTLINFFPRLPSDIIDFPDIAVSTTGRYLAYEREAQLRIRDTTSGQEIATYGPLKTFDTITYSWVRRLFDDDDRRMAFGINRSDYQTIEGGWEIVILDLTTGRVIHTLTDTDPAAQNVRLPGFNFVPIIQQFEGDEVTFNLFPDGIESGPAYAAWTWNIETGKIVPNHAYTNPSTDYLASTGEVMLPAQDPRFETYPCEGECLQFVHQNTLQIFDPITQFVFPFFHSADISFQQVHFVQGGEKILAQGNGFQPNPQPIWYLIGRDGSLIADVTALNITSAANIPEGMIYARAGLPDIFRLDTRDKSHLPNPVWTTPDGSTPLILWASTATTAEFTPWAQLTPPA